MIKESKLILLYMFQLVHPGPMDLGVSCSVSVTTATLFRVIT